MVEEVFDNEKQINIYRVYTQTHFPWFFTTYKAAELAQTLPMNLVQSLQQAVGEGNFITEEEVQKMVDFHSHKNN